ncbi:PhzF family phenazine biosynthesis isomerase [Hymenobacter sp. BT770]|uniref:PhzF family phenazine biosynthesis protein n=1 Tax=Hymenobacter sp. BT770 TaxID=2886942 RepID=UPI001D10CFBE|nr:PhzF family phenazine biosynthesis isomerase [Hymenobacter sp. BT770]MCC3153289.1 PhzF family phenazine biosynthesis protein [Hymenobacter sp. BT770]MDO3414284.1 PhzF family phenazine biosynthesis isomerase [Hymenobacter sp. BT770]
MKTYIVDSFTKEPFKGNPAGVCLLEQEISEEAMLKIAQEFGLSETAFVRETGTEGLYAIRYFSPKQEIPLCGHATLASAKVLFKHTQHTEIHFLTHEQVDLLVTCRGEEITMEFPVYDTVAATVPAAMLQALGLPSVVNTAFSPKNKIIILEIADTQLLAALRPDFNALLLSYTGINGVLVTAASPAPYDYHYRYFWPWAGTNEDPVTGGVQTFLAKYWATRLHKRTMQAFQSSSRTGYMQVELQADKVLLTSQANIVLEGTLVAFNK